LGIHGKDYIMYWLKTEKASPASWSCPSSPWKILVEMDGPFQWANNAGAGYAVKAGAYQRKDPFF